MYYIYINISFVINHFFLLDAICNSFNIRLSVAILWFWLKLIRICLWLKGFENFYLCIMPFINDAPLINFLWIFIIGIIYYLNFYNTLLNDYLLYLEYFKIHSKIILWLLTLWNSYLLCACANEWELYCMENCW